MAASRAVELISLLLDPCEREIVLGDLTEAGESSSQALLSIAGLVIRRQASLWSNWRPWLAAFGLAVPGSFFLMGFSLSIARSFQLLIGDTVLQATGLAIKPGLAMFLCNTGLLAALAWTGSFAVGTISRRTAWASAACSLVACSFCFARFNLESMTRFCLLLFLPPAIAGLCVGFRTARVRFRAALATAIAVTVLTVPEWNRPGAWLPNWALSWPAWYLVAIAARPETRPQDRWRKPADGQ